MKLTGSTLAYSSANRTLTITLGTRQADNGKDNQFISGSALMLSLANSVLATNGVALTSCTFTSASKEQFGSSPQLRIPVSALCQGRAWLLRSSVGSKPEPGARD
jgi:hypothetical protein